MAVRWRTLTSLTAKSLLAMAEPEAIATAPWIRPNSVPSAVLGGVLDFAPLQRGSRTHQPPGSGSLGAGQKANLEPTLILAVMAVESGSTRLQSPVGPGSDAGDDACTKTNIRSSAGSMPPFDPVTNLRVGVQVLKDCVRKAGNLENGLKLRGAANLADDGGYAAKVMAEFANLRQAVLVARWPRERGSPASGWHGANGCASGGANGHGEHVAPLHCLTRQPPATPPASF